MIRYPITETELRDAIDDLDDEWLDKAAKRIRWLLATHGSYTKDRLTGPTVPSWSDVKAAYRELQGQTCAYCEKPLEGGVAPPAPTSAANGQVGAYEHDLEHYRPKSSCARWMDKDGNDPPPDSDDPIVAGRAAGYHWLAYHPWNYCASCKTCNSEMKSNAFPIIGPPSAPPPVPAPGSADVLLSIEIVRSLSSEKALLMYPIGDVDTDPEDAIHWRGMQPVANTAATDFEQLRAQATIAFFGLNRRDFLRRERAEKISLLWGWHQQGKSARIAAYVQRKQTAHCGCLRAFWKLLQADEAAAKAQVDLCEALLDSVQPD